MSRMEQADRLHMTDYDDNPDCVVVEDTRSEHLIRRTFKDGHISWERLPHDPVGYEQDCFEEAYQLGLKAFDAQLRNLRANMKDALSEAQGRGAFQAAVTAYERTGR